MMKNKRKNREKNKNMPKLRKKHSASYYIKNAVSIILLVLLAVFVVYSNILAWKYIYDKKSNFGRTVTCVAEQTFIINNEVADYAMVIQENDRNNYILYKNMTCDEFNEQEEAIVPIGIFNKICLGFGFIFVICEVAVVVIFIGLFVIAGPLCWLDDVLSSWINAGGKRNGTRERNTDDT